MLEVYPSVSPFDNNGSWVPEILCCSDTEPSCSLVRCLTSRSPSARSPTIATFLPMAKIGIDFDRLVAEDLSTSSPNQIDRFAVKNL
ncbi:hypothetical protein MPTK1_1g02970 [Marchantia polymorpha subsp. ruderalis]|uniref:Uncharacterized protein n=2 Tax=Marchantia polymorpha TaxID=3197 RepID=A0AAF6AKX4_MARPO|nr:hypothetical protein MARPO_0113s0046 [Marchantia polymorpha]BBM97094.1 hypothetical protein Mp_1g02970 [Marchantia polymorpha subsp. ruderalis]|eukprot:PTQ31318.1 hypothetical protein MARPO_0113s0046 [Marchantia polymorpha]